MTAAAQLAAGDLPLYREVRLISGRQLSGSVRLAPERAWEKGRNRVRRPRRRKPPEIYEASLGADGAVSKGAMITQVQAEAMRQAGQDVVVCGSDLGANRRLAGQIERNANRNAKRCPPHANAGAHALPHTISLIPGRRTGTPFMKRRTERPSEMTMRYFTPDLYLSFNSADEEEADQASEAWEAALASYRKHLDGIRDHMPSQVRKLSEVNLHDAKLLACDQPLGPHPFWSAMAIVSIKYDEQLASLIYVLWEEIREYPSPEKWPFSKSNTHWLYDEVDVASERPHAFLHRVLLSDGRVLEIPFLSVVIHRLSLSPSAEGVTARQSA